METLEELEEKLRKAGDHISSVSIQGSISEIHEAAEDYRKIEEKIRALKSPDQ